MFYKNISGEKKLVPGKSGTRFEVLPGDTFQAGKGLPACYFKELNEEEKKDVSLYKTAPSGKRPKKKKVADEPIKQDIDEDVEEKKEID